MGCGIYRILEKLTQQFEVYDNDLKGKYYLELGQIQLHQNKLQKANVNFYQALLLYEKINHKTEVAYTLTKLGFISALFRSDIPPEVF